MYIDSSANYNEIKYNDFLFNNYHVMDYGYENKFEHNYWSGWTEPDDNNDGVVDYPYAIGPYENTDPVPRANLNEEGINSTIITTPTTTIPKSSTQLPSTSSVIIPTTSFSSSSTSFLTLPTESISAMNDTPNSSSLKLFSPFSFIVMLNLMILLILKRKLN